MNFYKKIKNGNTECLLCGHRCSLGEGAIGICGVNQNIDGEIKNLVYGYPISLNVDPIEKKPLYHFLPGSNSLSLGTVGCDFKCQFCQNWSISQEHTINKGRYLSPEDVVELAIKENCQSISYTYNEPTIFYPYARDIAKFAKDRGLKNIFVSNGFQSDEVMDDMMRYIDAVNIDLKSFSEDFYKKIGGDLNIVLKNLKTFSNSNIWLEVTTLLIPNLNDSSEEIAKIATFIAKELGTNVPWHISAFHPAYRLNDTPRTPQELLDMAYDIGKENGVNYTYQGNTFVDNSTYCASCNTLLIERNRFNVITINLSNGCCPECKQELIRT